MQIETNSKTKFVIVCNEWNFRLNELVVYADGEKGRILIDEEVANGILLSCLPNKVNGNETIYTNSGNTGVNL